MSCVVGSQGNKMGCALWVGGAYSLSPVNHCGCLWAGFTCLAIMWWDGGWNLERPSTNSFSSSDRPCGTSPSACVCRGPAPARRPSSTAELRGTRSSPAPSCSRWATCRRWLCSGTSPLPGTGGRAGHAMPTYRAQGQNEQSLGTTIATKTI